MASTNSGPTQTELQALEAFSKAYDARKKTEQAAAKQLADIAAAMRDFAAEASPAPTPVVTTTSTASTQPATTIPQTSEPWYNRGALGWILGK